MIFLLTGGAACGKSSYAEQLALQLGSPRYYIAAMQPYGEEGELRIRRHRAMRAGKGFQTIERYTDLQGLKLPEKDGVVLLECLCNLTANEMFSPETEGNDCVERILSGVEQLAGQCRALILITNEIGGDGGGYPDRSGEYIEALGCINQALAQRADQVWELVCGIPIVHKGQLL
ncbi:MAG: bifunctional adenosylcobinamide kinase/adenosylcobinamide-phosphate guanylyltransferase [Bacillota bacterium]|nr:bifunctional adenosylcobinamide kinase/adenosylcobinamide-phosphate guanylyltransferase [Bacillota bacterium]